MRRSGLLPLTTFQFFGPRACPFAFLGTFCFLLFEYALLKTNVTAFLDQTPVPAENVRARILILATHVCVYTHVHTHESQTHTPCSVTATTLFRPARILSAPLLDADVHVGERANLASTNRRGVRRSHVDYLAGRLYKHSA